jgi:hypothetical protein
MSTSNVKKRVLLIGLDPKVVDFAAVPGMTEARLAAGLAASRDAVEAAGFDAAWCLTDVDWASASAAIREHLLAHDHAAVMIGAGIRTLPPHFLLFEKIVNLVHETAPGAKLCFNTSPDTTPDAVLRWVSP